MNALRLWEPFSMLKELDDALGAAPGKERVLTPRTDIAETDKGYEINLEISGIDRKDLNLEIKHGVLTVSGEKKFEEKKEGKNYITVERSYGKFSRSFSLPEDTNEKAIKADYKDGILKIAVPKTEVKEDKPLKIDVS